MFSSGAAASGGVVFFFFCFVCFAAPFGFRIQGLGIRFGSKGMYAHIPMIHAHSYAWRDMKYTEDSSRRFGQGLRVFSVFRKC